MRKNKASTAANLFRRNVIGRFLGDENARTPSDIDEFIELYSKESSIEISGLLGEDLHNIPKSYKCLDVGCGVGRMMKKLRKRGYNLVYGFDIEKALIKKAVQDNLYCVVGNAESIPYKSASFDIVICKDLLEHVIKPSEVISEIKRVLKLQGYMYLTAANGYSMNDILFRWGGGNDENNSI